MRRMFIWKGCENVSATAQECSETKQDIFDKIFSSGAGVFDTHTCCGFSTHQGISDGSVAPDTISKALMNFK